MKDKEKQIEFKVIDNNTGKEADIGKIALKEDWAKGLMYCDMQGFAILDDGNLVLLDECGKFEYCPSERFSIKFENSDVFSREELAQKIYDDIFAILKIKLWLYGDDAMTKNFNGLTKQKILDFTKKWGIKDNHLNEKDYSHIDHLQAHDKQIKEQERKETAEKIYKFLCDDIGTGAWTILKYKKFIKEQFGV